MRFTNEFVVSEPVEQTWQLLTDVPRIAPCLPGATVVALADGDYEASIAVRIGPIKVGYQGIGRFSTMDRQNRVLVLQGRGQEKSGKGSASAVVRLDLSDADRDRTRVAVSTELQVTGKVAQFGRSAMADVSQRLIDEFAQNLKTRLSGSSTSGAGSRSASGELDEGGGTETGGPVTDRPAADTEFDALVLALPVLKRIALPLAGVLAGFSLGWMLPRPRMRPRRFAEAYPNGKADRCRRVTDPDRSTDS